MVEIGGVGEVAEGREPVLCFQRRRPAREQRKDEERLPQPSDSRVRPAHAPSELRRSRQPAGERLVEPPDLEEARRQPRQHLWAGRSGPNRRCARSASTIAAPRTRSTAARGRARCVAATSSARSLAKMTWSISLSIAGLFTPIRLVLPSRSADFRAPEIALLVARRIRLGEIADHDVVVEHVQPPRVLRGIHHADACP